MCSLFSQIKVFRNAQYSLKFGRKYTLDTEEQKCSERIIHLSIFRGFAVVVLGEKKHHNFLNNSNRFLPTCSMILFLFFTLFHGIPKKNVIYHCCHVTIQHKIFEVSAFSLVKIFKGICWLVVTETAYLIINFFPVSCSEMLEHLD